MPPHKTPDDDIESGEGQATTINEETPLLISQSDHQQPESNSEIAEDTEQNEGSRYTRSYFAWRIFWAIATITVTVVFVKAWIDAGSDVNVSSKSSSSPVVPTGLILIDVIISSTSRVPSNGLWEVVSVAPRLWYFRC